jgi:hypothetical protein
MTAGCEYKRISDEKGSKKVVHLAAGGAGCTSPRVSKGDLRETEHIALANARACAATAFTCSYPRFRPKMCRGILHFCLNLVEFEEPGRSRSRF